MITGIIIGFGIGLIIEAIWNIPLSIRIEENRIILEIMQEKIN